MGLFGRQPGQPRYSGELHNLQLTEAVYATSVPIVGGTVRLHPKLIFYGGFYAQAAPSQGGKGLFGGKGATLFEYFADVLGLLCAGSASGGIQGILNVWNQSGKLYNQSTIYSYTVPSGGGSVQPTGNTPPIQHDLGATKSSAYSHIANDYGAGGSQTLSGTQQIALTKVSGSPGAGQYSFNPSTSTYSFSAADAGAQVSIVFSAVFSLYYYEETQPALIPASSPYTISTDNQSFFYADQGVKFSGSGTSLTKVSGTPSAGEYSELVGFYTFAAADAGKGVLIDYEYYSSDANLTNASTLNLTIFSGTLSQSPWSYMTTKYPGAAFGFSTIAYIGANPMYLGESATMPSYNYEVMGLCIVPGTLDMDFSQFISVILTDPFVGCAFPSASLGDLSLLQSYWLSNNFIGSAALNTPSAPAQTIQRWLEAGNAAVFFSEGILKWIPYGDTTAVGRGYTYTPPTTPLIPQLTNDDVLPWKDEHGKNTNEDPIQYALKQPQDCYNYMQVQWTNRANDYNNDLIFTSNDAFIAQYGRRIEPSQTWEFLTSADVVKWALQLRLNRALYLPETGKFRLPFTFSYIEPMDMILLPTGEPVRITGVDEDEDGALTLSFENWTYGSSSATVYGAQGPSSYQPNLSGSLPGNAVPVFVQSTTTSAKGVENNLVIAACGQNPNWGGCNIWVSLDGTDYSMVGTIQSPNIVGVLSAALPSGADPDTTDTLGVDITLSLGPNPNAELVTVSKSQADNFVTLCAIVDPAGTNELISFETATLTATGRYNLTYLRRGVYGTAVAAHSAAAWFAYLGTNDLFNFQYWPQYAGQSLFVKLQSFNLAGGQVQDLSTCKAWQLFIGEQGSSTTETYVPSTNTPTISGDAAVTNPANAYDKNFSTIAQISAVANPSTGGNATCTYAGFGTSSLAGAMTLNVNCSYNLSTSPFGSASLSIQYSKDGGTTWNTLLSLSLSSSAGHQQGSTTLQANIPAGTSLASIQVQIQTIATSGGAGTSDSSEIDVAEIWLQ